MAANRGKNWTMWLAGILVTLILFVALPTMATQIWTNDRRNTDQHSDIKNEMIKRDEDLFSTCSKKIEKMVDIITEIRIDQKEQMTILKRLDK